MRQGEALPTLTTEQQAGLELLKNTTGLRRLIGPPGSGKSTLLAHLAQSMPITMLASTNKAAKIIGGTTVHKILGLRVRKKGGKQYCTTSLKTPKAPLMGTFAIDESSMNEDTIIKLIRRLLPNSILVGDSAQLNPVGHDEIPFVEVPVNAEVKLTKVHRHAGEILETAYKMRAVILGTGNECTIPPHWFDPNFETTIKNIGEDDVVVAWRNKTVNRYNRIIQMHKYGTLDWVVGQKVRVGTFFAFPDGDAYPTEHEAEITGLREGALMGYRIWYVELDGGKWVPVIHEDCKDEYQEALDYLSDMKNWKKFWPLLENFCDLRPGHAITAHKSQGSTYRDVYIDYGDIFENDNYIEAMRAAYVGTSRAQRRVIARQLV